MDVPQVKGRGTSLNNQIITLLDKVIWIIKDVPQNISSISIDLIISPFFEKSEILQRIKSIADKKYEYPIKIYYRNDFNYFIDDMYKEIGVVDPIKTKTT